MITKLILSAFIGVATFVVDLFPEWDAPAWLVDLGSMLGTLAGEASAMAVWIPFPAVVNALASLLGLLGIALAIKVIRIVASFLTMGGGSAA